MRHEKENRGGQGNSAAPGQEAHHLGPIEILMTEGKIAALEQKADPLEELDLVEEAREVVVLEAVVLAEGLQWISMNNPIKTPGVNAKKSPAKRKNMAAKKIPGTKEKSEENEIANETTAGRSPF